MIDISAESDTTTDSKKPSIPHKIASASKLSEDLKLVSSEVTGRIPMSSPASQFGLDTHFISQKPGCRKVRHLSSNSSSEKKGAVSEGRKKRNHRRCSYSSSSQGSSSR